MKRIAPPPTFTTLQVVSDLQSAARMNFPSLADCFSTGLEPELRALFYEQECKLTARQRDTLHAELMMIASMPDKNQESFLCATIILLLDRLQYGAGEDDLFWNWNAFHDHYRDACSPVRAALMNGFRCAHQLGLVELDRIPSGSDLLTYDACDLKRLLTLIARSMTEDTLSQVCALAPNEIADVHRKALENCLRTSCILSEFGNWFPVDVVERASLESEHPGYAACTALMILDAIDTGDATGKMAHRYEQQAEDYNLLPPHQRVPLLAGLRHLHEMDATWEPYAAWSVAKRIDKAIVMPFPKT